MLTGLWRGLNSLIVELRAGVRHCFPPQSENPSAFKYSLYGSKLTAFRGPPLVDVGLRKDMLRHYAVGGWFVGRRRGQKCINFHFYAPVG